jgi:hypothetical protein
MPTYTVPINGPGGSGAGTITVNASDPAAAAVNASQGGNTVTGPATATGGGSSGGSSGGGGGSSGGGGTGANLAAGSLLLQQAQQAAYQAYLDAKLKLDTDTEAYTKAAQEAATVLAQAGATGTYNGMPTQAAIKQAADIAQQQGATMLSYATQFGTWGMPQAGQQTLASQQQAFNMANTAATQTGWYTPYTATQTQANPFPQGYGMAQLPGQGGSAVQNQSGLPVGSFVKDAASSGVGQVQPDGSILKFPSPQAYLAAGGDPNWGGITTIDTAKWNQYGTTTPYAAPTAQTQAPGATDPATGQPVTYGVPPGYQAGQPVQTLAGQQQQFQQGLDTQKERLAEWQAQQTAAQNYMTMMAGLRGPADWAKYQQVLGATPGGTQDLVRAAAGQYIPGGGATTGVQPTPVSMNSFYTQLTGTAPGGGFQSQPGGQQFQTQGQTGLVPGTAPGQMPLGGQQFQTQGGAQAPMSWDQAMAANPQYAQQGAPDTSQLNAQLNQTPKNQLQFNTLVAPNQMAPQTWNALQPSQQQMLLGVWESQGYSKDDAQNLFNQSLPKYAAPAGAGQTGSFRLQ